MTRREEREEAFKLIFELGFLDNNDIDEVIATAMEERELVSSDYISQTVKGTMMHLEESDDLIEKNAKGWKVNRISRVSLSILRLAIYEILHNEDVPESVAINEAVELAKKFDVDDASAFINGVLGAVSRRGN